MYFYRVSYNKPDPGPNGFEQMETYRDANNRTTISFNSMIGVLNNKDWVSQKTTINIIEYYRGDEQGNIPINPDGDYYETGRYMVVKGEREGPYTVKLGPGPVVQYGVDKGGLLGYATQHFNERQNLVRPYPPPPQAGGRRRRHRRSSRRSKRRSTRRRRHTRRH